jgi:hypothetical protein
LYLSPYGSNSIRWWPDIDGEELDGTPQDEYGRDMSRHQKVMPSAWLVWTRNQARRAQALYYARLYGGIEEASASPLGIDPAAQIFQPANCPYNIVRSGTNTLVAKVAKNRPVPMYLPVGADHRVHKKARLLNKFVSGLFFKHKVTTKGQIAARDAALFGTGLTLVQPARRRISVEKLFPWEVYVDPVDARYGDPRCLYLIRYIDKDVLAYYYPDHTDAIERAPVLDESFFPVGDAFSTANRCTVVETWHLRAGPGAKDGRHTVCLIDETLKDERYDQDDFPIARLFKDAPLAGWWGMGLGDELSGFQDETNVMSERVSYAHRTVGGQIWLVPEEGGMLNTDFNDEIGPIVRYQGGQAMMPQNVNPQPVNEQTYAYFKDLPNTAYGFSGISTMSVQSQKPAGVTAALALQTLDDIETDRFSLFERAYEDYHVDLGRLMLRAVRQICERYPNKDFKVFAAGRSAAEEILWRRDIDLKEDSFMTQAWPVSLLPKTPAAKLQRVMELSANGIFDKPQVLKLMELPDTSAEESLMLAPREVADAQLNSILEHEDPLGEGYNPPEKYQDLAYSLTRADSHYARLQADAIDKGLMKDELILARLTALRQYMDLCKNLQDDAAAEAQAKAQLAASAAQLGQGAPVTGAVPTPTGQAAPIGPGPIQPTAPQSPAAPIAPAQPASPT